MSVNGLDAPSVKEAWDAALVEAGGWFLLRYTSRDDVELYARGTGGHAELQSALTKYPEKSPLYGFLIYRRRKIVLKYLPEGTSRLLQARTTVHFQTVTDYFSPHDATLDATSPDQVSETSLSSICKLHTASSSSSLRSSARKQQLGDISEVVEPPQSPKPDVSSILARIREDKHSRTPKSQPMETKVTGEDKDDDADSLDKLLGYRRRNNRSLDLQEALALGPDEVSGSEDSAVHSLGGRRPTTGEETSMGNGMGTQALGQSQAYVPDGWKPKRRLFTRSVEEDAAEDARERAKLPAGIHIRRAEEEAAKAAEEAKIPKSPKRPKSSKRRSSRSSKPRPLTSDPNDALQAHAIGAGDDLQSKQEVPMDANTLSSGTALQAGQTSAGPVHASQNISAADEARPLKILSDFRSAVNANGNVVQFSKKASSMTPERQRLIKALQSRNKQQSSTRPESSAAVAGSAASQSTTLGPLRDPQEAQTPTTSMRPAAQALLGPTSGEDHPMAQAEANARRGRSINDAGSPPIPHDNKSVTDESRQAHATAGANASDYFPSSSAAPSSDTPRKGKRRTLPRPIDTSTVDVGPSDGSSASSFSDDLQNATVHEAMRVAIPQTPMTPTLSEARATPRNETPTGLERNESVRSAQSALYRSATHKSSEKNELQPIPAGQAIAPATLVDVRRPSYSSKRQNVSSGISRRIQALEERSQRSSSPVSTTGHRSPSGLELPPSFAGQGQGHSRNMSLTSRPSSRASSRMGPTPNRFQPMDSIRDVAMSSSPNVSAGKGSTFSLTARILRPTVSKDDQSSARAVSPHKGAGFNRSRVTIDQPIDEGHASARNLTSKRTEPATPTITARPSSRGSSVSEMKRASIDFGLKFMGRKKSENRSPTRVDKSSSVGSLETVEEDHKNDATSPKSGSRTGRFFKRMSNLSNKSKRSPSEDAVSNFGEVESRQLATARLPPRASSYIVGDVNVQFPDSLFWKRRWVEVDGSGNLVLSPSHGKASRTPPKKYHLSSFDPPTTAGPDRQEMPHSIVLDFVNGGNIQLASDDRVSQGQVLKRLSDAHKAWAL